MNFALAWEGLRAFGCHRKHAHCRTVIQLPEWLGITAYSFPPTRHTPYLLGSLACSTIRHPISQARLRFPRKTRRCSTRAVIDVVDRVGPAVVRLDVRARDGRAPG